MYRGFPRQLIPLVRCPRDRAPLRCGTNGGDGERILEASLACERCGAGLEIREGILDLSGAQDPLDNVSSEEAAVRDRDAGGYDGMFPEVRNASELPSTLGALGRVDGATVLELGCGTGRVTMALVGRARRIIALDFSRESLLILARKLDARADVGLVLGDATQTRVSPAQFDIALSTQVLEHVPGLERRASFFKGVAEGLTEHGVFVCTAYHHDWMRRVLGKPREGRHPSNIFYHYFTLPELRREMQRFFSIEAIRPIQIPIPLAYRLRLSFAPPLSRLLERVPIVNRLGHLVLVRATKRLS